MSEATTTPVPAVDVGDAILSDEDQAVVTSQLTDPAPEVPAAEAKTEETHADPVGDESASADAEVDNDLVWLQKKANIDPNDPDILRKTVEAWKNADKDFHATRQEAKQSVQDAVNKDEAATAITDERGEDPRIIQLERNQKELMFFIEHPEAKERQPEIIATAKKFPKLAADFDLDTLYAIAKSERLDETVKAAESKGRQAAKAEIAKSSTAAAPAGMASGPTETQTKDLFDQGFDSE